MKSRVLQPLQPTLQWPSAPKAVPHRVGLGVVPLLGIGFGGVVWATLLRLAFT
jgi:hypothetical protein